MAVCTQALQVFKTHHRHRMHVGHLRGGVVDRNACGRTLGSVDLDGIHGAGLAEQAPASLLPELGGSLCPSSVTRS